MNSSSGEGDTGCGAEAGQDLWLRHVAYARSRDPALLGELVGQYYGYAAGLARRLHRGGEAIDDLVQVALEALVRALQRFDPTRSVPFVGYATPTIVGALKRHYRDRGWALRVPRTVQDIIVPARQAAERLTAELGRSPRTEEIAERAGVSVEELLSAEEAAHARATASLDVAVSPEQTRGDLLGSDDGDLSRAENRAALGQALQELSDRDRAVLELYFRDGWSQECIGTHFGVSQMQISRWLARAVNQLRTELAGQ